LHGGHQHRRIVTNCASKEIKGKKARTQDLTRSAIAYVLKEEGGEISLKSIKDTINRGRYPLYIATEPMKNKKTRNSEFESKTNSESNLETA